MSAEGKDKQRNEWRNAHKIIDYTQFLLYKWSTAMFAEGPSIYEEIKSIFKTGACVLYKVS